MTHDELFCQRMKPNAKKLWLHSLAASVVAVFLSLFGYVLNHSGLSEGVFLFVPFCTGLAIAFMSKGKMVVAITGLTSLLLSLSVLLLAGFEGIACVAMAFPILLVGIGLGALVGYLIGKKFIHQYGNISMIALCLGAMSLVGWTNKGLASPKSLNVKTSMHFHAPMDQVWDSVTKSGTIEGDDTALRILGLPVPVSCSVSQDGVRVCYFESGEMVQRVTASDYGHLFQVEISDSLRVRDWITFLEAKYEFVQQEGFVQVIRTDAIESRLRPRWYWHWFEEQCVQLEHRFVMESMKRKAEQTTEAD